MNWVAIDELSSKLPIPPGYRIEQLKRSEIPEVIHCFRDWFPDITVGAESCYQREDFYSREVSLEGEPERDWACTAGGGGTGDGYGSHLRSR